MDLGIFEKYKKKNKAKLENTIREIEEMNGEKGKWMDN